MIAPQKTLKLIVTATIDDSLRYTVHAARGCTCTYMCMCIMGSMCLLSMQVYRQSDSDSVKGGKYHHLSQCRGRGNYHSQSTSSSTKRFHYTFSVCVRACAYNVCVLYGLEGHFYPAVDLGPHFCNSWPCRKQFTLMNRGRWLQALSWTTQGFSTAKLKKMEIKRATQDLKDVGRKVSLHKISWVCFHLHVCIAPPARGRTEETSVQNNPRQVFAGAI